MLFGSDGPWLHPGVELAKVRALGLPEAQQRLVLGGNLLRLVSRVREPDERPRLPDTGTGELPAEADPWAAPAPLARSVRKPAVVRRRTRQ